MPWETTSATTASCVPSLYTLDSVWLQTEVLSLERVLSGKDQRERQGLTQFKQCVPGTFPLSSLKGISSLLFRSLSSRYQSESEVYGVVAGGGAGV